MTYRAVPAQTKLHCTNEPTVRALPAFDDEGRGDLSNGEFVAGEFVEVLFAVLGADERWAHLWAYSSARRKGQGGSASVFGDRRGSFGIPTMTRLTLFFYPGRIKRGCAAVGEIGPALQSGRNYTLTIARDLTGGRATDGGF